MACLDGWIGAGGHKTRLSPTCARVISGRDRSRRTIRSANYSRNATGERQGQHQHQKFPHGHLRCLRCNVSRLGMGEGDRNHRFVDCRLSRTLVCNLCDSGHLQRSKNVAGWTRSKGSTTMKRLLILVPLGLFLAAHGAVDFMSIYPQPALEDGGGASSGNR